jgi:NADH-quinone oxidoreductase E subunit
LSTSGPFAFTPENDAKAKAYVARYPEGHQASAILPLMSLAQAQHGGWLPKDALDYLAEYLQMPRIRVYEVASFYDMFNTKPVGRIQIRVCRTTPCWLCGSDEVLKACEETLGIKVGESTEDGRFFLREFECLGACANAPILWIDDDFYEDLDGPKTKAIIEALQRGEQPKAGSQRGRQASMPAGGKTTLLELPPYDQPPKAGSRDGGPEGDSQDGGKNGEQPERGA